MPPKTDIFSEKCFSYWCTHPNHFPQTCFCFEDSIGMLVSKVEWPLKQEKNNMSKMVEYWNIYRLRQRKRCIACPVIIKSTCLFFLLWFIYLHGYLNIVIIQYIRSILRKLRVQFYNINPFLPPVSFPFPLPVACFILCCCMLLLKVWNRSNV